MQIVVDGATEAVVDSEVGEVATVGEVTEAGTEPVSYILGR